MKIVPAAAWRRETWRPTPRLPLPVGELWVHHGAAGRPDLATLRSYERYHVRTRGWAALGYCWAIDGAGTVYEGRGPHVGAHTSGRNDVSVGVLLIGDWTTRTPPGPMIRSLAELTQHLHTTGVLARAAITGGHGDAPGASTTCPGAGGRVAIGRARRMLTTPSPPPTYEEVDVIPSRLRPAWDRITRRGIYSVGTANDPLTRAEAAWLLEQVGVTRPTSDGQSLDLPTADLFDGLYEAGGNARSPVHSRNELVARAARVGVGATDADEVARRTLESR